MLLLVDNMHGKKHPKKKVKTGKILTAHAICYLNSCSNFALWLHENALVFSQSEASNFSCALLCKKGPELFIIVKKGGFGARK